MIQKAAIYALDMEYKKKGSSVLVFYGREGCGKEECLREFLKRKDFFYYRAAAVSSAKQKERFLAKARQRRMFAEDGGYRACFEGMRDAGESKLVIVIDEFEHMVRKDSGFIDTLFWFKRHSGREALILLCSSSLVFVEHKLSAALGDGVSEIDRFHKLAELDFLGIVRMFPEKPVSECVEIFGVLGGVSSYLEHWDAKKGAKENICKNILSPSGSLFLEAERYLRGQLRELSVYNTILTAIASGCRTLNGLYHDTGYSRAKISVYLGNLTEFDVVEKVVSFETEGAGHAQRGVYQIKNTFLHFWFRFVFPYLSDLYLLAPEEFYDLHIAGELDGYLEHCFIQVCMEYMKLMNRAGKLPIQMSKIETWIGKSGKIDIVAQDENGGAVVGICSWAEDEMPYKRYEELEKLMGQAKISAKCRYLFSGKSFAPALQDAARQDEKLILVDMTEL